jgi:hypothetical protein
MGNIQSNKIQFMQNNIPGETVQVDLVNSKLFSEATEIKIFSHVHHPFSDHLHNFQI